MIEPDKKYIYNYLTTGFFFVFFSLNIYYALWRGDSEQRHRYETKRGDRVIMKKIPHLILLQELMYVLVYGTHLHKHTTIFLLSTVHSQELRGISGRMIIYLWQVLWLFILCLQMLFFLWLYDIISHSMGLFQ